MTQTTTGGVENGNEANYDSSSFNAENKMKDMLRLVSGASPEQMLALMFEGNKIAHDQNMATLDRVEPIVHGMNVRFTGKRIDKDLDASVVEAMIDADDESLRDMHKNVSELLTNISTFVDTSRQTLIMIRSTIEASFFAKNMALLDAIDRRLKAVALELQEIDDYLD